MTYLNLIKCKTHLLWWRGGEVKLNYLGDDLVLIRGFGKGKGDASC